MEDQGSGKLHDAHATTETRSKGPQVMPDAETWVKVNLQFLLFEEIFTDTSFPKQETLTSHL